MATNPLPEQRLQPLFEVRLNYVEGKPAVSMHGKVGEYLGSGEGTFDISSYKHHHLAYAREL